MSAKVTSYLFIIASTVLLLSAALYIKADEWIPRKIINYAYAVSGAVVAVIFLSNRYKGPNFRLKRLNIQQVIAALLLPVSSYFMFKQQGWFVFLLISAFLQIYVVIVRTIEDKKEN